MLISRRRIGLFGQAKVNILWGQGFDRLGEILDYAIEFNVIKRSGSWYSYGEIKLGQGAEGVKSLFEDNPELLEEITEKVMDKLKSNVDILSEEIVEISQNNQNNKPQETY